MDGVIPRNQVLPLPSPGYLEDSRHIALTPTSKCIQVDSKNIELPRTLSWSPQTLPELRAPGVPLSSRCIKVDPKKSRLQGKHHVAEGSREKGVQNGALPAE